MNLLRILRFDFLPRSTDAGLLVLRLWFGLCMAGLHGWGKLTGYSGMSGGFADPFGIGPAASLSLVIFAEFFCAILIVLGLFTRFAALVLSINMLTAFFVAHNGALSGENSGEMAFLFFGAWLVLLIAGAGRYSLDAGMGQRRG